MRSVKFSTPATQTRRSDACQKPRRSKTVKPGVRVSRRAGGDAVLVGRDAGGYLHAPRRLAAGFVKTDTQGGSPGGECSARVPHSRRESRCKTPGASRPPAGSASPGWPFGSRSHRPRVRSLPSTNLSVAKGVNRQFTSYSAYISNPAKVASSVFTYLRITCSTCPAGGPR